MAKVAHDSRMLILDKEKRINPLPTNDAYMRHELPYVHKNLYGGLILGVNTLYRLFCFFKLFPVVGKGLTNDLNECIESVIRASCRRLFHKNEEEGTKDALVRVKGWSRNGTNYAHSEIN